MTLRPVGLIARTVLIEAVRRKEIYAIVLVSCGLIAFTMSLDFFQLEGLDKFYREMALKTMSIATALTCIVLAARQLPREFETRTIYPLLARPISRWTFLVGKLVGVLGASLFCLALFMVIFLLGTWRLGGSIAWGLFTQYVYLQGVMMLVLASLSFLLSMMLNLDAAICIGILFFGISATYTNMLTYLYDFTGRAGQMVLWALNYALPQVSLFDLSAKAIHAEAWPPLGWGVLAALTAYGLFFAGLYMGTAMLLFRRRAL